MPNTFRLSLRLRIILGILTPGLSTCWINMTITYQLIETHRSYDLCRLYGVWLASVVASLPILSHRITRCKTITRTSRIDEGLISYNDVIYMIPAALDMLHTIDAPERLTSWPWHPLVCRKTSRHGVLLDHASWPTETNCQGQWQLW